jgi:hypothetical protein
MFEYRRRGMGKAQTTWRRIWAGFALALIIALSAYLVIDASRVNSRAFASMWFLGALPAFLCALICYVGDPDGDREAGFYWCVPVGLVGAVIIGSAVFLHEGVVCLIMLSPIWLAAGWIGAFVFRAQRRRFVNPHILRSSLLVLPLMSGAIESSLPFPYDHVTLTRHCVVNATPEEIWPYTLSNPHIGEDEGRWTFSQNIVGLPHPSATIMHGSGVGAVRTAFWGPAISFDEIITSWQPGVRLGWNFSFTNSSIQTYTDQHIAPDGQFLKIESGDYTMVKLAKSKTLLTLRTNYVAKSHVNLYAELWGEILMGDVENNILAIVKNRAEAAHRRARA